MHYRPFLGGHSHGMQRKNQANFQEMLLFFKQSNFNFKGSKWRLFQIANLQTSERVLQWLAAKMQDCIIKTFSQETLKPLIAGLRPITYTTCREFCWSFFCCSLLATIVGDCTRELELLDCFGEDLVSF